MTLQTWGDYPKYWGHGPIVKGSWRLQAEMQGFPHCLSSEGLQHLPQDSNLKMGYILQPQSMVCEFPFFYGQFEGPGPCCKLCLGEMTVCLNSRSSFCALG